MLAILDELKKDRRRKVHPTEILKIFLGKEEISVSDSAMKNAANAICSCVSILILNA